MGSSAQAEELGSRWRPRCDEDGVVGDWRCPCLRFHVMEVGGEGPEPRGRLHKTPRGRLHKRTGLRIYSSGFPLAS